MISENYFLTFRPEFVSSAVTIPRETSFLIFFIVLFSFIFNFLFHHFKAIQEDVQRQTEREKALQAKFSYLTYEKEQLLQQLRDASLD